MPRNPQEVAAVFQAAIFLATALAIGLPPWPVEAASENTTATDSIVIGGSVTNSTINNTINQQDPAVLATMAKTFADQMAATTEAKAKAEAKAAELAAKFGFTSSAVAEFFKILGEQNVPDEKVPTRLIEIASHFAQTRDTLAALEPDDPHTAGLARSAKQALDSGQLAEADALLDRAKEGELAALRQARELKQKAQEAEDRHALSAARFAAGQGDIALTQLRYTVAAGHFQQAANLVPLEHPNETAGYLNRRAGALFREGDERGDNDALKQSIQTLHRVLQYRTRNRVPLDWAMTQMGLGLALSTLGERESGTAHLDEAVAAFRAALEERTRKRVPLQWAMTQNNLGNALRTLGARESGTGHLEEAVAAYRAALEEQTRDRVPLQWATSTGNQGVALMLLAERLGDESKARVAVQQIGAAFATIRDGGSVRATTYYKTQLTKAQQLSDRLTGR